MGKNNADKIEIKEIDKAIQYIEDTQKSKMYKWELLFKRILKKKKREVAIYDCLEEANNSLHQVKSMYVLNKLDDKDINFKLKRRDINRTIIIFASVPFYDVGGGQRSAQLAKTFNEMGYIVHYIYGFECSEENIPDMFIPTATHKMIDDVSVEWYKEILANGALTIFEIPYVKFKPYLDIAKKYKQHTVYEHIDNWDSSLGCMFYDPDVFKSFIEEADLITVTAKMLGEKIEEKTDKDYIYLPNAVNINIFEPGKSYECPKDLVIGKRKTLLYFGSLWGEWFDWEKIIYIAENCKDVAINLIGDDSGIRGKMGKLPENIHFLGLKAQTLLPAYLQHCDVTLLPFKNCEIGKYVSPLKIFEYIAMNKKVIAGNLDDIQNYPNVYASDAKEDWLEFLNQEEELVSSEEFIAKNNWYSRCAELLEYFEPENDRKESKLSVIVLNYNNKKVIERCVRTLLNHNRRYGYEIIVVDNSLNPIPANLFEDNRLVSIYYSDNIRGAGGARNEGIKKASGKWILFMDADDFFIPSFRAPPAPRILSE